MERGYLVAVLAMIATFSGLSHGFRSLEQWSFVHFRHGGAVAGPECPTNSAARMMARLKTHLRPHNPEEAQLLAEMNVPAVEMPDTVAAQYAAQQMAGARCAREHAMQQAMRAQRNALRLQREMERSMQSVRIEPLAVHVELPADFEQQVQQASIAANKIAIPKIKLRMNHHCTATDTQASAQ